MSSFSDISSRIAAIRSTLPQGVELVAVSKFHPLESILEAAASGQRLFGESRVQELERKVASMAASESTEELRWHFIGHLQTNKVRKVVAHASLIHSIDSERLLRAVDDEAAKAGREPGVLLQLHVAKEETKFGFTPEELLDFVTPELLASLKAVEIRGVMGMASNVDDEDRIRSDFREIRTAFDSLRAGVFASSPSFSIVSMGMSHDWPIAVEEGGNMIRVGTSIFGEREY